MDILDDMGVSKFSAKVFSKVNYSFKSCCPPVQNVPFSQVRGQPNSQKAEPDGVLETGLWTGGIFCLCAQIDQVCNCWEADWCLCHLGSILRNKDFWETWRELLRKAGGRDKKKREKKVKTRMETQSRGHLRGGGCTPSERTASCLLLILITGKTV